MRDEAMAVALLQWSKQLLSCQIRFCQSLLEDMRCSLPAIPDSTSDRVPPPLAVLIAHQARQQLVYDTLRRHFQKRETQEFIGVFRNYEDILNLRDEYNADTQRTLAEISKQLGIVNQIHVSGAILTGLAYGWRSWAEGEDVATRFYRGLAALAATYIEDQPEANDLRTKVGKVWSQVLQKGRERFASREGAAQIRFCTAFTSFVKANWPDAEFYFQVADGAAIPTQNPFLIVKGAYAVLLDRNATVEELIDQARICCGAADMVPPQSVYNLFRAYFLSIGGKLASRAATKDLGATGLPLTAKDAPDGGKEASRIWNRYIRVEPIDSNFTDDVVQAYILACAYAGDPDTAYLTVLNTVVQRGQFGGLTLRTAASSRPSFWYDCARICSIEGNTVLSLECLTLAVKLGFRGSESAKLNPDLKNVRSDRLTGDQFRRLFP